MWGHGVAGDPVQLRQLAAGDHRFRAARRHSAHPRGPGGLVGPLLGAHRLRLRRRRPRLLRHGGLRLWTGAVQRRRCGAPGHAGGVHARRKRGQGLLRREPGRWLQPADGGGGAGRRGLRRHGVRGGPEPAVPVGAEGRRRGGRRMPERVRGVRHAGILLQRRIWEPRHVPAVRLLADVQVGVPALVQLRLRRRHEYVHLRRPSGLRHHLLPRVHHKSEGNQKSSASINGSNGGR